MLRRSAAAQCGGGGGAVWRRKSCGGAPLIDGVLAAGLCTVEGHGERGGAGAGLVGQVLVQHQQIQVVPLRRLYGAGGEAATVRCLDLECLLAAGAADSRHWELERVVQAMVGNVPGAQRLVLDAQRSTRIWVCLHQRAQEPGRTAAVLCWCLLHPAADDHLNGLRHVVLAAGLPVQQTLLVAGSVLLPVLPLPLHALAPGCLAIGNPRAVAPVVVGVVLAIASVVQCSIVLNGCGGSAGWRPLSWSTRPLQPYIALLLYYGTRPLCSEARC